MRVLFTTQPGTGHLHPLLPLAAGMRGRSHEVAFASSASFASEIRAAEFDAFTVGLDWLTLDMARAFPEVAATPPGQGRYAWARSELFAGRTAAASVPDLHALADAWRPDLVVREAAEYGGCVAAEVLDVPHAMVRSDSGSSSYGERHHLVDALNEQRAQFGLPADPTAEMPFRYPQLSFAPAGLDEPADEAAAACHHFRPTEVSNDRGHVGDEPAAALPWLAELPSRPTVYATLGTVYNWPELLAAIIDGLEPEDLNLVVSVGPSRDPRHLRPASTQRPHRAMDLPGRCPPALCRGRHSRRVRDVGGDDRRWSPRRVHPDLRRPTRQRRALCRPRCVGRMIGPDERSPDAIRGSTLAVLGDLRFARTAERLARASRRRPGLEHALDLFETLARNRVPLIAPRLP